MAKGTADLSGRAIYFDKREPREQGRAAAGVRTPGSRASAPDYADIDDLIDKPDGVQFDDAGVNEAIYEAYGSLRNFLVQARARGFDPTQGPDPSVPGSAEYVAQWHRALAAYEQLVERGVQGKENMDELRKAHLEGKALISSDIQSGETGVLSAEEFIQGSASMAPEWIVKANEYLAVEPTSLEEQKDLEAYHKAQIDILREEIADGKISPQFEGFFLSMLRAPQKYNPAADNLKKAQADQARAAASNQRAQAARTRKEMEDGIFPELGEMAINLQKVRQQGGSAEVTDKMYVGRRLGGDPKGPRYDRMEVVTLANGQQGIKMVFVPEPGRQADPADAEMARAVTGATVQPTPSGEIEIFITEDNPAAAWYATLSTEERAKASRALGTKDDEVETGELDLDGTLRVLGMTSQGGQQQPAGVGSMDVESKLDMPTSSRSSSSSSSRTVRRAP